MSIPSSTAQPYDPRSVPQALRVTLVLAVLVAFYWWASGGGTSNEIDNHRLVVAECWNALERKTAAAPGASLEDQARTCQRMERGFAQMYGTGA